MNNQETTAQAGKFAVVGVLNTLLDFAVLNILVFVGFTSAFMIGGQKFLVANIISVAVAMAQSFILNKQWTFRSQGGNIYSEIIKFLAVTIIGMFVIHQIIFNLFYYQFKPLSDLPYAVIKFLRLGAVFSAGFVSLNFSKAAAVIGSLIWNFLGYKFIVFKK